MSKCHTDWAVLERDDERFGRVCFSRWLSAEYPGQTQKWDPVPQPQQPPDFRVRAGKLQLAVEVTRIMSPDIAPGFTFRWLAARIEETARAKGALSGLYLLVHYPPVSGFAGARRLIELQALDYMTNHASDSTAPLHMILSDERDRLRRRVVIQKMLARPNKVLSQQGSTCLIEGEIDTMLAPLVREAVVRKTNRFDEVGEGAARVLVLVHDFPMAGIETYRRCMTPLAEEGLLSAFSAVYLAFSDSEGAMLYCPRACGLQPDLGNSGECAG